MRKKKAEEIIESKLKEIENTPYEELKNYIGEDYYKKFEEKEYWGDIQVLWDDKPNENIRVMGSISYSFFTSFFPICDSYIITPNNELL